MSLNNSIQKCDWLSRLQDSSKLGIIQNCIALTFRANRMIYEKNFSNDAFWVVIIIGAVRSGIDGDCESGIIKHLVYSEEDLESLVSIPT